MPFYNFELKELKHFLLRLPLKQHQRHKVDNTNNPDQFNELLQQLSHEQEQQLLQIIDTSSTAAKIQKQILKSGNHYKPTKPQSGRWY